MNSRIRIRELVELARITPYSYGHLEDAYYEIANKDLDELNKLVRVANKTNISLFEMVDIVRFCLDETKDESWLSEVNQEWKEV